MEHRAGLLRGFGFREIATGVAILASGGQARWLWARVIGDALDLAALAPGAAEVESQAPRRRHRITALDAFSARQNGKILA